MRRSDADPRPMPRGCSRVRDKSTTLAPQDAHTLTSTYPLTELHTPLRNPHRSPRHTSHLPSLLPSTSPSLKKKLHTRPTCSSPPPPSPQPAPQTLPSLPTPRPPHHRLTKPQRAAVRHRAPVLARLAQGTPARRPAWGRARLDYRGRRVRGFGAGVGYEGRRAGGGVVVMVRARLFGFGLGLEVRGTRMGALGVGAVVGLQSECWRGLAGWDKLWEIGSGKQRC